MLLFIVIIGMVNCVMVVWFVFSDGMMVYYKVQLSFEVMVFDIIVKVMLVMFNMFQSGSKNIVFKFIGVVRIKFMVVDCVVFFVFCLVKEYIFQLILVVVIKIIVLIGKVKVLFGYKSYVNLVIVILVFSIF